jgi:hypothetical protein
MGVRAAPPQPSAQTRNVARVGLVVSKARPWGEGEDTHSTVASLSKVTPGPPPYLVCLAVRGEPVHEVARSLAPCFPAPRTVAATVRSTLSGFFPKAKTWTASSDVVVYNKRCCCCFGPKAFVYEALCAPTLVYRASLTARNSPPQCSSDDKQSHPFWTKSIGSLMVRWITGTNLRLYTCVRATAVALTNGHETGHSGSPIAKHSHSGDA